MTNMKVPTLLACAILTSCSPPVTSAKTLRGSGGNLRRSREGDLNLRRHRAATTQRTHRGEDDRRRLREHHAYRMFHEGVEPELREDADGDNASAAEDDSRLRDAAAFDSFRGSIGSSSTGNGDSDGDTNDGSLPSDYRDERIIGGDAANTNDCPSCVSMSDNQGHFCGGSLIAPNMVLTAAHCLGGSYKVQAGMTSLGKGRSISMKKEIGHPKYSASTTDSDFAVLVLESSFDLDGNGIGITEINAQDGYPNDGAAVHVYGYGDTNPGWASNLSNKLMKVQVNTISNAECGRSEGKIDGFSDSYKGQITENMMCAKVNGGGKDACQGDSGGPLFVQNSQGTKQVGVVSWGVGCAEAAFPGVYSRISKAWPWIKETVCDSKNVDPNNPPPASFGCGGASVPAPKPPTPQAQPKPPAPQPAPPVPPNNPSDNGGDAAGGNDSGQWSSVLRETFDNGAGTFTGGQDTKYVSNIKNKSGIMKLQLGNIGAAERSAIATGELDVGKYENCRVLTTFYFIGMESNDSLCAEYSTNGGKSFKGAGCFDIGKYYNKRWWDKVPAGFGVSGSSSVQVRIRIKGNHRKDDALVDEVEVECQ